MELQHDDLIKVLISVLCGSLLGFEREYRNKTAGFRTIILICLGSTIFTMLSQRMGGTGSDDRVAANIITGIGFIGAGVIFKDNYSVTGITTAAVIWVAAAIGMSVGISEFYLAGLLTGVVIFILSLFHHIEGLIDLLHHGEYFSLTFQNTNMDNIDKIEKLISDNGLHSKRRHISKNDDHLTVMLKVSGKKKRIRELSELLIRRPEIVRM
jgi:putative Mg2+ transporter-C (MgtC) family protein